MYVVTGGAGFIGSNLVKLLNKQGIEDILIVDDCSDASKLMTLKTLKFLAYRDLDNINWTELLKLDIQKVFHCGGISSTTETDGKRLLNYNYTHTLSWSEFCQLKQIPLVYTSSASVYGNSKTFVETDQLDPLNPYAVSKHLSEVIASMSNTWVFRPFNVYGSGEQHKGAQQSPISKFKEQVEQEGIVTLFHGSDKILRDFVCVDDVVNVMVNYTSKHPGIYNLGSGVATSFLEIARLYTDNLHRIDMPNELRGKYQYYSKADLTKLRTNLIGDYKFIQPHEYVCQH